MMIQKVFFSFCLFLILSTAISFYCSATEPIILSDTIKEYDISKNIVFLADTAGQWTIEDISSESFANKFSSYPLDSTGKINYQDTVLRKIISRIYWMHFTVDKTFSTRDYLLRGIGADTVLLYIPDTTGNFTVIKSGHKFCFADRDVPLRNSVLMNLQTYQNIQTFYVKIINEKPELFFNGLITPTIVDKNYVLQEERKTGFFQALLAGIFLTLIVYNLMLFLSLRDISYLFYVLYILSFGLFWIELKGYGFEFFYPNHPDWNNKSWILGLSFMFFYVLFGKSFLNTKKHLPKWNIALIVYLTGQIIFSVIIYFLWVQSNESPEWINNTIAIWYALSFLILIIPAILCWRNGYRPARYFLIANLLFVAGIAATIVTAIWGSKVKIAGFYLQIGISLEVIVFSLGLGNRFNLLQEEKEKAQEKALEVLEQKVQERTVEVVKQKDEIAEQKKKVEEHQKEIIDSITYAKRLQQAILPPVELIKKHFPESFLLYKPKDIVAGDFYWMEVVEQEVISNQYSVIGKKENENAQLNTDYQPPITIFLAAADCTGHGVPGAMVSVVCSNALNRAVKEFGLRDTGKILDKVTDLVLETFEKSGEQIKDGMDISLLSLEFADSAQSAVNGKTANSVKKIQWSGANNPLLYIQNGQIIEVKADKQPIGKFDVRKPFTTHEIPITQLPNHPITFYLFTDGYPDQFGGPKGKKFKYKQLEEILLSKNNLSLEEQRDILEKAFAEWKGSLEQVDDVTVIGIRV